MKILVITQKYDINDSNLGAFIDWWDKLAEKMEKVYVLALEEQSGPTKPNMEVLSMGKESGAGFFRKIFGFYYGLLKTIGKVDVVLVHMIPKYVILSFPIAVIFRKPIYLWYTGVSANRDLRFAAYFCRKIFTAHEAAMRINTPKRVVTGHGIDVNKFKCQMSLRRQSYGASATKVKSNDEITILSVGRVTPSKGHDLIIRAVSELVKRDYDLKLKIIGGVIQDYHRPYLAELKSLTQESGIGDKVEFIGPATFDKMPGYLNSADILINAVPFGGLDKVVLEAMASCVIPLTSNSAFTNVFPKDFSKNLIFGQNKIEDLKEKLKYILDKKLYENEILRRELREVIVQNHNLNNLVDRIIKEMSR